MREKLRNNVASDNPKKDFGAMQKKFLAECKSLCAPNKKVDFFSKLPRPFEFYNDIFQIAFENSN